MDGKFSAFKQGDTNCVVQNLARKFKEESQQRLAKIANGKDPRYKNGKTLLPEYQLAELPGFVD